MRFPPAWRFRDAAEKSAEMRHFAKAQNRQQAHNKKKTNVFWFGKVPDRAVLGMNLNSTGSKAVEKASCHF